MSVYTAEIVDMARKHAKSHKRDVQIEIAERKLGQARRAVTEKNYNECQHKLKQSIAFLFAYSELESADFDKYLDAAENSASDVTKPLEQVEQYLVTATRQLDLPHQQKQALQCMCIAYVILTKILLAL